MFNVQIFLHLLFSLNYLILPQVTTSYPFFCLRNHRKWFLNLVVHCHHNLPTQLRVFNLLFLAPCHGVAMTYVQQVVEFGLWQDTSSKSPFFANWFLMGMFCLNCHQCSPTLHRFSQMQGMDRKYHGHAWCKAITTTIKNNFGFRKACCLGHLHCVQDDCENFVHPSFCNEIF